MHHPLLAIVQQSPNMVKAHNKNGWIELFSSDGTVEDPVGPAIHRGAVALGKFWDAFIGSSLVTFDVKRDFIDEKSKRVIRIVDIHAAMKDFNYQRGMIQPAHLIYQVASDNSNLVTSMQAHWEVARSKPMSKDLWGNLMDLCGATLALRHVIFAQGIQFTLKFCVSFITAHFYRGKRLLRGIADAANSRVLSTTATNNNTSSPPSSSSDNAKERFLSLFVKPNQPCIYEGGEFITPQLLWDKSFSKSNLFMIVNSCTAGGQTTMWVRRTDIDGRKLEGFMMIRVSGWFIGKIQDGYWYEEVIQ
jgi:hypothetical protein